MHLDYRSFNIRSDAIELELSCLIYHFKAASISHRYLKSDLSSPINWKFLHKNILISLPDSRACT